MNIPANSTEAHTIVLHSLIRDMREVLDLAMILWVAVAANFAIDAIGAALDHRWISTAIWVGFAAFAARMVWKFLALSRKYRTMRGDSRGTPMSEHTPLTEAERAEASAVALADELCAGSTHPRDEEAGVFHCQECYDIACTVHDSPWLARILARGEATR